MALNAMLRSLYVILYSMGNEEGHFDLAALTLRMLSSLYNLLMFLVPWKEQIGSKFYAKYTETVLWSKMQAEIDDSLRCQAFIDNSNFF